MASNLRVDTILPSTGANVSIGTATGGVTIPGDLGIAGVLTYEDVTNIDSVGVITARDGLRVTGVTTITGTGEYLLQLNKSDSSAVYTQFTNSTTGTSTSDGFRIGMDSNEDGLVWLREDGNVKFGTNNSERLRIDTSGNVTANTGNIIIGTAGKGIDYSAQTATSATGASTTAEILNHYEEGSWTPVFLNVNTPTYSSQYGRYTRVGSQVTLIGQIQVASGLDTSDGSTVNIGGFPFVGNSSAGSCIFTFGRFTSLIPDSKLADFTNVRFGGNYVMLLEGNNADISYAECNSSGLLQFSVSYIMNT